ncbi:MAG: TldD/PmbA family protein [Thermoplasmata archaeon]|nr:TldD/PmbA family protein [Thermoplasmata archaeon]
MSNWNSYSPADLPEAVVKKAVQMGADDVVVTSGIDDTKQIRFANNSITTSKSWASTGLSIYLTKDKRILSTQVNELSEIDRTLDELMKRIKMMQPNEEYGGIYSGKPKFRKNVAEPTVAAMVEELFVHVDAAISSAQEAGASRVAGVLYSSSGEMHQATSGGSIGTYGSSSLEISVRAMSDAESSGHMVQSVTSPMNFEPARVGRTAGELAIESRNPEIGKEGKFDVVFSPMIFANIMERVGSSCSAGSVDAGMSFFTDMIGKKVASEKFTCYDDATNPESLDSLPFDEEGAPTGKTSLIEKGILKTYLHNTSTAKRYGTVSTGNAGLVFPSPWTTCLEPGQDTRDQLISQVNDGYYMTNTWYTRFQNYQTGDFSTIPRDAIFHIKNGKLDKPVKDIRISENMLNILKNVKAVGNDPMQVHWWEVETPVFVPHVLVENVNITKSTQ